MQRDIDRILIDRDSIADRVDQLGQALVGDLASVADAGELVVMPVMTGSLFFAADLVRQLPLSFRILPVTVSSYPGTSVSSQGIQRASELPDGLKGRTVLLVDDIFDSGGTLDYLTRALTDVGVANIVMCVLLRKDVPRVGPCPIEERHVGFDIPDAFVVGYGLDYDGLYRNLPDIATLREEVIGRR
jgi:hypoxanthine phosphoribosyltransferase